MFASSDYVLWLQGSLCVAQKCHATCRDTISPWQNSKYHAAILPTKPMTTLDGRCRCILGASVPRAHNQFSWVFIIDAMSRCQKFAALRRLQSFNHQTAGVNSSRAYLLLHLQRDLFSWCVLPWSSLSCRQVIHFLLREVYPQSLSVDRS